MSIKTHKVYKEVIEKNGFYVGKLFTDKGECKFKVIEESSEEVQSKLNAEMKKYKRG